MQEIWQSATGISVLIGPFLDVTDGKTPETGIDLTTADSALVLKHGVSASLALSGATFTALTSGWYALNATSTMFDTVGMCTIYVQDVSVCLPVWKDIMVVPTAYWQFKYGTTKLTVASVSNSVSLLGGQTIASISNSVWFTAGTIVSVSGSVLLGGTNSGAITASSFGATAIASAGNVASVVWDATASTHALTTSYGLVLGGMPSTTTLASAVMAVVGKTEYLPSATLGVASLVWSALSSSFGGAGTFGGILGALGAGADPWSSTVTAYTGTNTFGLLLGGLPSTTSLASVVAAIVGKTAYLSSATVGDWTIASMTGSVYALGTNIWGKTAYLPSITMGSWSISGVASVSNSVHIGVTDVGSVTGNLMLNVLGNVIGTVASVSSIAVHDVGTVGGGVLGNIIGTLSSVSGGAVIATNVAAIYGKLPTKYYLTGTNELDGDLEMASVVGVFPNDLTGTLASVSGSVLTRGTTVASIVWSALSSSFGVGGTFGGILGAMAAGADPWLTTVTAYTGTNTFGLLLGGLPSTTTLASALYNVCVRTGGISVSAFGAGAIADTTQMASTIWTAATITYATASSMGYALGTAAEGGDPWAVTVTAHTATNSYGLLLGGLPSTTTLASVVAAINGKTYYLPSATLGSAGALLRAGANQMASFNWEGSLTGNLATAGVLASAVWAAATADWATASSMGDALQDAAAGGNPWGATVTAFTGTNTFGLILGGIPSATTLASVVAGIAGKTSYLPSATVNDWTVGSASGVSIDPWAATVTGYVATNTFGLILGGIPSATTLASVVAGVAGKTSYLPSITVGSWSISGVASVSIVGYVASVSGSMWGVASSVYGKIEYMPSVTMGSWSISYANSVSFVGYAASVSGSAWGVLSTTYGKIDYLPSITMGSWSISAVASVSIAGLVGSVSASVVEGFFEEIVEGTTTFRTSQKYQNAFAGGLAPTVSTGTVTFRDIANSLDRIKMTVDDEGHRTSITRNDG